MVNRFVRSEEEAATRASWATIAPELWVVGCPHPPLSARASRLRASGCPHPPPSAFPVSAHELPRRSHRGRRGCVLRSRQIVLLEPPGIDAALPAEFLLWEAAPLATRATER